MAEDEKSKWNEIGKRQGEELEKYKNNNNNNNNVDDEEEEEDEEEREE